MIDAIGPERTHFDEPKMGLEITLIGAGIHSINRFIRYSPYSLADSRPHDA